MTNFRKLFFNDYLRSKRIPAIFFSIMLTFLVVGYAKGQVSLDDCQVWARENYPEIKRYGIIDATEACNLSNASKNWLPMVSIDIQGGWHNSTSDLNDLTSNARSNGDYYNGILSNLQHDLNVKAMPNWQYRAGVEVVQTIYDGGATSLQREMARKQAETDRAKIEVSLHKLEEKVLDVYFSILLLEDRKEQMVLRGNLLDKNLQKLRNLEKEGVAKLNDVEAVEVEQLKLKQNIDMADENLDIYRKTLSLLTGHDLASQDLVRPTMPNSALSSNDLFVQECLAFSQMADMQLIDKESELLDLKNRSEQIKRMPKLGLMGLAFYGFPGNNLFRDIVNRNPMLNLGIGLKLTWDLTPLYTRKNNLAIIRHEQEKLENQRHLLLYRQRQANTSQETRMRRLETIRKQDDHIVELYRKLRIAEETKVNNNTVDATELLSKISDEADAQLLRSIHETEILYDVYKLMIFGNTEK